MDEQKKQAILKHIDSIIAYAKQPENRWLLDKLMRRLNMNEVFSASTLSESNKDIRAIRESLEIRGNLSISYDFIKEQRLRDQLRIDNLRMENAALNLREKEIDRFYTFCVNAFYQVENVINYYFHVSFSDIDRLLSIIEDNTRNDGDYAFKRTGREENVGDIAIFYKINAICNILFPKDKSIKTTMSNLRRVRNEGEHRCQIIFEEKDDNNKLYQFLKKETFNSLRISLIRLVRTIQKNINEPIEEQVETNRKEGFISTMLPSACFATFDGKNIQIPSKLFNKVRGLVVNDTIVGVFEGNNMVGIESVYIHHRANRLHSKPVLLYSKKQKLNHHGRCLHNRAYL